MKGLSFIDSFCDPSSLDRTNDQNQLMGTFRNNKIVPEDFFPAEKSTPKSNSKSRASRQSHSLSPKRLFELTNKPSAESRRMSFAKFTENIGKMTKNAINEISGTVKQSDFKEEYRKGLIKALNFLDIGGSKNPLLILLKNFIFFNIQVPFFLV